MRLVLDPSEDVAHGEWLRTVRGAYEWWYFDALSDDGEWALACIWFLGNPFSPYYRLAARGEAADPFVHNALFFALYRDGRLHAYHFTRFPRDQVCADETTPATLRFGPNDLTFADGEYRLALADENANGRRLEAWLSFCAPPLVPRDAESDTGQEDHVWLPAAPSCRVSGAIRLSEAQNTDGERIAFRGRGYHDHNWGTLPFAAQIRDWYWARLELEPGNSLIVYHVRYHGAVPPVSHLLCFQEGRLIRHEAQAQAVMRRVRLNGFGLGYATVLEVRGGDLTAKVRLGRRLDSAPFYVRALCCGEVTQDGRTVSGAGLGEYFRPRMLARPLVASATKARIVVR